jgi:DMSO/TMAO reductase YedYZ molybdopterin-dependent catalytic subunit
LLAGEVTPNDRFFRVDVNLQPPVVDPATWRLRVWGLVKKPLKLGYEELKALPAVEEYATLECVSNEVGGDLISTARWRGVRLRDLLKRAGVMEEATYIVFRCQDGYDVGIPLERGLMEGTLLAYEMNGAPLPREHGFPLRAVVPGYYGMMNPKWITEIEVVGKSYEGFWQRRGWANEATYQTHSWIALPGESRLKERFPGLKPPRLRAGQRTVVAGVAFAGDRGIRRVEVSVDGGETWEEATVKDPLSGYTWVLWAKEWVPQGEGGFRLMVRATDGEGFVQLAEVRQPFPAGATGYHVVEVKVEREG